MGYGVSSKNAFEIYWPLFVTHTIGKWKMVEWMFGPTQDPCVTPKFGSMKKVRISRICLYNSSLAPDLMKWMTSS